MQELHWLETHVGSIEKGVELINQFYWNLTVVAGGDQWIVRAGDTPIFRADTHEAVDAFLYGMALGYSIIPGSYVERFRKEYKVE